MAANIDNNHVDLKQMPDVKQLPSNVASLDDSNEQLEAALRNYVPGTQLEKKLVRKIDLYMIPTLWFMCVLCYLNRNNIGNANAAGMSDDLGLNSSREWHASTRCCC
jgi:hypothetical protein